MSPMDNKETQQAFRAWRVSRRAPMQKRSLGDHFRGRSVSAAFITAAVGNWNAIFSKDEPRWRKARNFLSALEVRDLPGLVGDMLGLRRHCHIALKLRCASPFRASCVVPHMHLVQTGQNKRQGKKPRMHGSSQADIVVSYRLDRFPLAGLMYKCRPTCEVKTAGTLQGKETHG
jgi:hypothetical protein